MTVEVDKEKKGRWNQVERKGEDGESSCKLFGGKGGDLKSWYTHASLKRSQILLKRANHSSYKEEKLGPHLRKGKMRQTRPNKLFEQKPLPFGNFM